MTLLDLILDIAVVVAGGALAGIALVLLLLRLLPPDRRPYDFGFGAPIFAVIAGVGGSFAVLLPDGSSFRLLASLAGGGGIIGMSFLMLATPKKPGASSGTSP